MSPKTLIVAVAALTASSALVIPAAAATPEPGKMPLRAAVLFNLVDRNGDGAIDKDELNAVRDAIFAALDANKDGKLGQDELQAVGQGMRERAQQRFQMRHPGPGWGQRDGRDRDGRGPMWDDRRGPPGPRQGMMDERQGPPPFGRTGQMQGPGQFGGPAPQDVASADKDGDGAISRDEFTVTQLLPGLADLLAR